MQSSSSTSSTTALVGLILLIFPLLTAASGSGSSASSGSGSSASTDFRSVTKSTTPSGPGDIRTETELETVSPNISASRGETRTVQPRCQAEWLNLTFYTTTEYSWNATINATELIANKTGVHHFLTWQQLRFLQESQGLRTPENLTEISAWVSANVTNNSMLVPSGNGHLFAPISVSAVSWNSTWFWNCLSRTSSYSLTSSHPDTDTKEATPSHAETTSKSLSMTGTLTVTPINTSSATFSETATRSNTTLATRTPPASPTRTPDDPTPYPTLPPYGAFLGPNGEPMAPCDPSSVKYDVKTFTFTSGELQGASVNFTFEAPWITSWYLKPILPAVETPQSYYKVQQIIEDGLGSQNGFVSAIQWMREQFELYVRKVRTQYNMTGSESGSVSWSGSGTAPPAATVDPNAAATGGDPRWNVDFVPSPTPVPTLGSSDSNYDVNATVPPPPIAPPRYPIRMYRTDPTTISVELNQFPVQQHTGILQRQQPNTIYEPEEDELVGLYFTPAYFQTGVCAPTSPQLVAKLFIVTDDKNFGVRATNLAVRVVTSLAMISSVFSSAAATDSLGLVVTGFMTCAHPNERLVLRSWRLLSPFALEETWEHMILGNFIGLACLLTLQLLILAVSKFALGKSMDKARLYSLFPGAFFTACCLAIPGFCLFSAKLVAEKGSDFDSLKARMHTDSSQALGYMTLIVVLLIPVGSILVVKEFVTAQFNTHKFHFVSTHKSRGITGSFARHLLPYGKWFPVEIRRAYSGMFAEYRRTDTWLPSYPCWGPIVVTFIASFRPKTSEGCRAQYFTIMVLKWMLAIFAMTYRPYRSLLSNAMAALSAVCFGITVLSSAIETSYHNAHTRRLFLGSIQLQLAITCARVCWLIGLSAMEATFIGDSVACRMTCRLVSKSTTREDERRREAVQAKRKKEHELVEQLMPDGAVDGEARPAVTSIRVEDVVDDPFAEFDDSSENFGDEPMMPHGKGILSPPQMMSPKGSGKNVNFVTPISPRNEGGLGSPKGSQVNLPRTTSVLGLNTAHDGSGEGSIFLKNFSFRSTGLSLHEELSELKRNRGNNEELIIGADDDDEFDDM